MSGFLRFSVFLLSMSFILSGADYRTLNRLLSPHSAKSLQFNGGAGALLTGPAQISQNPAALLGLHHQAKQKVFLSGGYRRNVSEEYLTTAASMPIVPKIGAGLLYSYNRNNSTGSQGHSAIIALSQHRGHDNYKDLFAGLSISLFTLEDSLLSNDSMAPKPYREYTVLADFSFMEINTAGGSNVVLTADNILGYTIGENSPGSGTYAKWTGRELRSIRISGINEIDPAGSSTVVVIPADLRFWGLLNKNLRKNEPFRDRIEFHTGTEILFQKHFGISAGYSWKSSEYQMDPTEERIILAPEHTFSGGVSLKLKKIVLNAAICGNTWQGELISAF
ncbi:MAG: hypothetical protein ACQEQV_01530 [Fibrobacterota bacterium]